MSYVIGTLQIEMAANVARLTQDMNQAKSIVNSSMKEIQAAVASAKTVFIALTGVAGVSAFQGMILGSIEAAAKLNALSIQSGMTVEALSGLAAVGRATGTGADMIAAATNKFSKALATSNEDSKGAATALKALGLSFDDFQRLSPDERMKKVADAMNLFKDGGQKSAAAMLLFGRAGAEMLPFMKDLANTGELHAKITKEQAEAAHQFEVQMGKLKLQSEAWKKALALNLLSPLNDILDALLELKKSTADTGTILGEGLTMVLRTIATLGVNIVYVFTQVGITLGGVAAGYKAFFSLDFEGTRSIGRAMAEDSAKARIEVDKLSTSLLGLTNSRAGAGRGGNAWSDPRSLGVGPDFKAEITGLKGDGTGGGAKDDPTKKILDGELKRYEEFIAAEKTQLQTRGQYLDFYRNLEYFDLRETEEKKQGLISDNLSVSQAAYDKEIAAITKYIAQAAKLVDQEEGRNKLAEAQKKRTAIEIEANKLLGDSLNTLGSIQRQFDLGTIERARQDKIANESAQFQIDMLGRDTLEVLKATEARRIQLALEERIHQERNKDPKYDSSGAIAQAATQTDIATAKIEESYRKQRSAVLGADEAVRKYMEDIGNEAAHMENLFTKAFKGMEDALVNFVKTGKLDFKSLADGIITDLIRIEVQRSVTKPLGDLYKSAGGASGIISSVKSFFNFADGGIMSAAGSMPLNKYAGGGVASSPQLAMFGEGSTPEAYVPLPDGRSIPVTMRGGAGSGDIVVNQPITINAQNASAETVGQIRALMPGFIAENRRVIEGVMAQARNRGGRG
jgi:lambda family phage tail tape measure protein